MFSERVFETGQIVGKYTLGPKLGQGGFGVVFVAHDADLDRDVALKFLLPEHVASPQVLQRFLQEARSAAKIGHPGIVTVFESGQISGTGTPADGAVFIAMELLLGETLSSRLDGSGQLEPAAALEICRQVASALGTAHDAGIVHRDLKPDNIYLATDPAMPTGERVKVLDFGIAKLAQTLSTSGPQTHSLMVFGTPRYMSPEQARSSARIDHRSDIYSLGCILFELVTGRPPFLCDPGEMLAHHQLTTPPRVRSIVPELSSELDATIDAMLAKSPDARPATMRDIHRTFTQLGGLAPSVSLRMAPISGHTALVAALAVTTMSEPPSATTLGSVASEALATPKRRGRAPVLIGVALAAGLAVFAIRGTLSDDGGSGADNRNVGSATRTITAPAPQPPQVVPDASEPAPSTAASVPSPINAPTISPPVVEPPAIATKPSARSTRANPPANRTPPPKATPPAVVSTPAPVVTTPPVVTPPPPTPPVVVTTPPIVTPPVTPPVSPPVKPPPPTVTPAIADRDHDGIPDASDACPGQPGPRNADPLKNGCSTTPTAPAKPKDGGAMIVDPFAKKPKK